MKKIIEGSLYSIDIYGNVYNKRDRKLTPVNTTRKTRKVITQTFNF